MALRLNRYVVRGRWYWRVWDGAKVIARGTMSYADTYRESAVMERELRLLFPHLVKAN